jgi:hypothetical protein
MSSGVSTNQPLQPIVEVNPAACGKIRRALDSGVAAFRRWGIQPPPGSWIQEATTWLDSVVARNSLGQNDDELKRTSSAIAMAVDLYHIGTCLGEDANRQVAAELAKVAHGRLLGRGDSAAGKDYLTQFWVGALLAQSKLNPRVIAYDVEDQSKPDFLIPKGKISFGVEVKRPRSPTSARRAVHKAASQLRTLNGPGIIIIDATECMSVDPWAVTQSAASAREQVRSDIRELHKKLRLEATSYTLSDKFSHVSMMITFARFWNWTVDESGAQRRDAGLLFNADGFGYLWSSQVTGLTGEIQDALLEGIKQLTGNSPVYKYS